MTTLITRAAPPMTISRYVAQMIASETMVWTVTDQSCEPRQV
jgi:hypothetical protein